MTTYYVPNSTNAAQEIWKLESAVWHSLPVHSGGEKESSCSETLGFAEAVSDKGSWYSWMGNNLSEVISRAVLSIEFPAMGETFYICAIQCTSPWPHVAVAPMTHGVSVTEERNLWMSLILINLNNRSWRVATVLYGKGGKDLGKTSHGFSYYLQWWHLTSTDTLRLIACHCCTSLFTPKCETDCQWREFPYGIIPGPLNELPNFYSVHTSAPHVYLNQRFLPSKICCFL